jgi:hypothetical protein
VQISFWLIRDGFKLTKDVKGKNIHSLYVFLGISDWVNANVLFDRRTSTVTLLIFFSDFEQRAVQVLEECHRVNAERAGILVKKKNEAWSGMNCLEMAAEAKDRVEYRRLFCSCVWLLFFCQQNATR